MMTFMKGCSRIRFALASLPLLLLLAMSGGGCQTKVCDARGPSDTCEIHHAFMESVNLPYQKQEMPGREYLEARVRFFPHSQPFLMSPDCPHCVFYICDYCEHAEQEWLKLHPQAKASQ